MSIRVSGEIHLNGYSLMMQMVSSISDFDSDSRPHFRPESFQRFIYFNKIQHFLLMDGDC